MNNSAFNINYKKIVLIGSLFVLAVIVIKCCFFRKQIDVKEYVINNNEKLTAFSKKVFDEQKESFIVYNTIDDLPSEINARDIYSNLRINYIAVSKNDTEEDNVYYMLDDKPKNQDYYTCGIYYSVNGVILDANGNAQSGEKYEYDGGPTYERYRYRSEKICDKWYYFEEARW